jgi:Activator of Hsp90 ATPase homolog 1-like protein
LPAMREEGYSRCTFELEPQGEKVKLTITHTMDKPDSKFIKGVSTGWPGILSSLKSLLETGKSFEGSDRWPAGM